MLPPPGPQERLQRIPLNCLEAHPENPNRMSEEMYAALVANLQAEADYPPIVVRPHPGRRDWFQILDGAHRACGLRDLGERDATCYLWDCDDATALRLVATLNRLHGEDVPALRAELLAELTHFTDPEELAVFLPEDAAAIEDLLGLLDFDAEALLADLTAAGERDAASATRVISFAVGVEEEVLIERVVGALAATLSGANRRGRALARICGACEEAGHGQ